MNAIQQTQNLSVKSLRQNGFRVSVTHYRLAEFDKDSKIRIMYPARVLRKIAAQKNLKHVFSPTGGFTEVDILDPQGNSYSATAKCHEKDIFNRHRAVEICLQRIISQL